MSVSLLLSTMLLSFQLSPILFRTFNCEFFTRPPLIIMGHQCLLSNTHDSFTRVEIDTPETQQTNPQMTNAVRVCTMPSVFLQSTNNSTRSHGNWLNYTLKNYTVLRVHKLCQGRCIVALWGPNICQNAVCDNATAASPPGEWQYIVKNCICYC